MTELEQMADRAAAAWYLVSYPGWKHLSPNLRERWLNVARAAQDLPIVTEWGVEDLPTVLRIA